MADSKGQPLVSIALCTYNGEAYLREQLETLIKQTYRNIEIVAVDDCSTDRTYEILEEYRNKACLRIYKNEKNIGFAKNFEKAISLCKGDFIALCDQDDIWDPEKIDLLVMSIGSNLLIYHDSILIDSKGINTGKKMSDYFNFISGRKNLSFIFSNCITGHSVLFRKELIGKIFPIPDNMFHDVWIGFTASTIGEITFTNKCLVSYRQHQKNVTDILKTRKTNKEVKNRKVIKKNKLNQFLENLKDFQGFKYLSREDKQKLTKLESLYKERKPLLLFLFLLKNLNIFFFIPRKSFFSKLNILFKEVNNL